MNRCNPRRLGRRTTRAGAALGLTALALTAGTALAATAGDLDPTFDGDGKLVLPFKITPGHVLPAADGKVLVTDEDSPTVIRLNADGSLDRGFGGDGIASNFSDAPVSAAALQPDGKLVVAGATKAADITVARLDTDGSLDETFGPGGPDGDGRRTYTDLQTWYADAMVVQPDGRIAIVGGSSAGVTAARLKADGEPDGTVFDYFDVSYVAGAALAPDGKLVVTGYTGTSGTTDYDLVVARFKADGPRDPALGGTGRVQFGPKDRDDVPASVLVQPDRRIVIAQDSGTAQRRMTVMRLTEAGDLDKTFAGDGTATPEFLGETFATGAALQPDGKIVVAGTLQSESDFVAARLDADGEPDRSFGADGKTQVAFEDIALAYAAGMDPGGRLVIAGLTVVENRTAIRTAVARVLADQPPAQPDPVEQPGAGSGGQPGAGADRTPPALGRVKLAPARFAVARRATAVAALRRGTTVRYRLSEPAAVTLRVERVKAGRRRAAGTLRRSGAAGANRVRFSGRIGRRALPAGRYRLTVRATDAAGNRSKARSATFRIAR